MSQPTPFVLPTGVSLAIGGNSLVVRHTGDILLEQALGRRISRIECEGDMTLRFGPITGVLHCRGVLRCEGPVEAEELRAGEVHLSAHSVSAHAIVAERKVVIGAAVLDVDVIVAPEVHIDPAATGRVRVIDCFNERPALRVRGCLSLEEFEKDFGGAAEFLAHRGVIPLHPLPESTPDAELTEPTPSSIEATGRILHQPITATPSSARSAAARRSPAPPPPPPFPAASVAPLGAATPSRPAVGRPATELGPAASHRSEHGPHGPHGPASPAPAPTSAAARPDAPPPTGPSPASNTPQRRATSPPDISAGTGGVGTATATAARPEAETVPWLPAETEQISPMHPRELGRQAPRIRKLVQRIVGAYADPPDPVLQLEALTHFERVAELPDRLDELWLALLRQHLAERSSPPIQVALSINALHALVFG